MDAKQRKRAFTFILITLTLDAMGIGLILPVMPDLIRDVSGGTLGTAALWGGDRTGQTTTQGSGRR